MDVFDYLSVERIVKTTKERVLNLTNIALIKASYKLLKISYNTDNLGFKNIKTNKPTSARGRHFQEEQFKQNYRDQICFCYELPLFLCLRRLNPAYLPSRC